MAHQQNQSLKTLTYAQIRRILRIWIQTIVPPAITTALYFLIFGELIGRRIGEMPGYEGFTYVEFMVPGLIMLSVITNAYANVASAFFGAKFQKAIEEIIISPMPNWSILIGFIMGGIARGFIVGIVVVLISLFFTNRVKNYNLNYLKEDFVSEKIVFDFLSLFAIVFFAFVILFPFYLMFVTSFKLQAALLYNPLDLSIDFTKSISDQFKSYLVIFKTYDFGRYILTSSIVSIGTVIITLIFAIPAAYAVAR